MESLVEQLIIANLVDCHPKAVNIRSFIGGTVHHLLRRHVLESSSRYSLFIQGCSWCVREECTNSRQAEVTQTWNTIFIDEDVLLRFLLSVQDY